MENNQVGNVAPVQPAVNMTPPSLDLPKEKGGRNYLLLMVGVVAVLLLIVGGFFVYKNMASKEITKTTTQSETHYAAISSLENELSSLDSSSVDGEFTALDADLKSL